MIEERKKKTKKMQEVLNILSGLSGQPYTRRAEKGLINQAKARKAAEYWKKKRIIKNVRQTEAFSFEDKQMKDLVITLLNGKEVYVQVKSQCRFSDFKRCQEKGVYHFWSWREEAQETVNERMLGLILLAYISQLKPLQIRRLVEDVVINN